MKDGKDPSLADNDINKNTKARRERFNMRYSPLVERYLITHNYETINNVRKWKMLLTQRTEIQKEVDKKFKKFKEIADKSLKTLAEDKANFEAKIAELNATMEKQKAEIQQALKGNKKKHKEQKDNGESAEQGNVITSIVQSKNN